MDLAPIISIVGTIGTLGGTALGAWITHTLAQNRSIHDKIWDQKQIAYSTIVHHTFTILSLSKRIERGYNVDPISWNISETRERLSKEMREEISFLGETISQHFLLLSMEFSKITVKVDASINKLTISEETTEVEWIGTFRKEMAIITTELVVSAKTELMRKNRLNLN